MVLHFLPPSCASSIAFHFSTTINSSFPRQAIPCMRISAPHPSKLAGRPISLHVENVALPQVRASATRRANSSAPVAGRVQRSGARDWFGDEWGAPHDWAARSAKSGRKRLAPSLPDSFSTHLRMAREPLIPGRSTIPRSLSSGKHSRHWTFQNMAFLARHGQTFFPARFQ